MQCADESLKIGNSAWFQAGKLEPLILNTYTGGKGRQKTSFCKCTVSPKDVTCYNEHISYCH